MNTARHKKSKEERWPKNILGPIKGKKAFFNTKVKSQHCSHWGRGGGGGHWGASIYDI
jgi:hypothetical protein